MFLLENMSTHSPVQQFTMSTSVIAILHRRPKKHVTTSGGRFAFETWNKRTIEKMKETIKRNSE